MLNAPRLLLIPFHLYGLLVTLIKTVDFGFERPTLQPFFFFLGKIKILTHVLQNTTEWKVVVLEKV